MNKLAITTFAIAVAFAASASAQTTTTTTTTTTSTAPHHHHHRLHQHPTRHTDAVVEPAGTPEYTEIKVGDPTIVYHEIGTGGSQRGNTIVPFYDEPIRSVRPYEIRYDYAEFR